MQIYLCPQCCKTLFVTFATHGMPNFSQLKPWLVPEVASGLRSKRKRRWREKLQQDRPWFGYSTAFLYTPKQRSRQRVDNVQSRIAESNPWSPRKKRLDKAYFKRKSSAGKRVGVRWSQKTTTRKYPFFFVRIGRFFVLIFLCPWQIQGKEMCRRIIFLNKYCRKLIH